MLRTREMRRVLCGDINANLIALYQHVQQYPDAVEYYYKLFRACSSRDFYKAVRHDFNQRSGVCAIKHAQFMYLNRAGYRGLHRVNKSGAFNVPYGAYKHVVLPNLSAFSAATKDVTFVYGDYTETCSSVEPGDFVYFDPPYDGTFTAYTANCFDETAQRQLASYATQLWRQGVKVGLSNSCTSLIRALYAGWTFHEIRAPRSIGNTHTTEYFISNY